MNHIFVKHSQTRVLMSWIACVASLTFCAAKVEADSSIARPQTVRDLYYGDALFYFYQEDYFQSLVHLSAASEFSRLPHHQNEAELLKGVLYLSLGQHIQAGYIFKTLLNDDVELTIRNRAWFYLAKIWYQRGYWGEAEQALRAIKGTLLDAHETERQLLLGEVLIQQHRYEVAISVLSSLQQNQIDPESFAYAQFNLGVALMRHGDINAATVALDRVGTLVSSSDELLALRDKANLALALHWIKSNKPEEAERVLLRIRLDGPESNQALLVLGWAQTAAGKFNEALVPWQELNQRNSFDPSVYESYLAIPYAYSRLGADVKAVKLYQSAVDRFQSEIKRLDDSMRSIRGGALLNAFFEIDQMGRYVLKEQPSVLLKLPENQLLYSLLASDAFKQGLRNYQDTQVMKFDLQGWGQNMDIYKDMLEFRRAALLKKADSMLLFPDDAETDPLGNRLAQLSLEIKNIENKHAGFDMDSAYLDRLHERQKQIDELKKLLLEAKQKQSLLRASKENLSQKDQVFSMNLDELSARVQSVLAHVDAGQDMQESYLEEAAVGLLEQQKQRLGQYLLQAQFALASILDRAANEGDWVKVGVAPIGSDEIAP